MSAEHEGLAGAERCDETLRLLEALRRDPTTSVPCVFDDGEPAYSVWEMKKGCVALPGKVFQPLCPQHESSAEPLDDAMEPIVDLSLDGGWGDLQGIEFRYIISSEDGLIENPALDQTI